MSGQLKSSALNGLVVLFPVYKCFLIDSFFFKKINSLFLLKSSSTLPDTECSAYYQYDSTCKIVDFAFRPDYWLKSGLYSHDFPVFVSLLRSTAE